MDSIVNRRPRTNPSYASDTSCHRPASLTVPHFYRPFRGYAVVGERPLALGLHKLSVSGPEARRRRLLARVTAETKTDVLPTGVQGSARGNRIITSAASRLSSTQ